MREFDPDILEREYRYAGRRVRSFDPRMIDEIMHMMMDVRESDQDYSLLVLAGFVREQMPWLAEVLVEGHRELKTARPEQAREIGQRLIRMVKVSTRGPWSERLLGGNKSSNMLLMELPHFVDRAVSYRMEAVHIADDVEEEGESEQNT